jgi:hypothetical protein
MLNPHNSSVSRQQNYATGAAPDQQVQSTVSAGQNPFLTASNAGPSASANQQKFSEAETINNDIQALQNNDLGSSSNSGTASSASSGDSSATTDPQSLAFQQELMSEQMVQQSMAQSQTQESPTSSKQQPITFANAACAAVSTLSSDSSSSSSSSDDGSSSNSGSGQQASNQSTNQPDSGASA